MRLEILLPAAALLSITLPASAQPRDGEAVFASDCAVCHVNPPKAGIPDVPAMAALSPNAILESLTDGSMRLQGQQLTAAERVAVAEFLAGRPVAARSGAFTTGMCEEIRPMAALSEAPLWRGWGPDVRNDRFQPDPGFTAADVPKLRLKWAFGIPDTTQSRSQPAVAGGRLFMGNQAGAVYALDAESGCTYWTFESRAGVRTAISVGPFEGRGDARFAIYFADAQARAYAVDAETGEELWNYKVDDHPAARATGSPTLHDGVLYVPTSGVSEETAAALPDYECCTFRGSLTALDAHTGQVIWKAYTVDEPRPRGTSLTGAQLYGPAGVAIWTSPTVDAERGLVYAATGNAYADPEPPTSDAIVAFDIDTGEIRWINQATPGDVWILGCDPQSAGMAPGGIDPAENPNCPEDVGPDYDFAASPALTTTADGRDVIVVPQKSGVGYALDPDQDGDFLWRYRWGQGSAIGGVWGAATDGERAYFAVADQFQPEPGGVHAVDIASGERVWYTPPQPLLCEAGQQGCSSAQSAALTAIPGVVFSGSADGGMRAYSAETGEIIWTYDTNRNFETVNAVPANGGSMDGPGPVAAGGILYVTAGNAGFVGRAGNVLLAFEVGEEASAP
jgi:polyvinyl alcohol dehydrogenase (cytochrome)